MKEIKVVLCGCESHVDKFGRMLDSYDESQTVGCWDTDPENAKRIAALVSDNCKVYPSYDAVLSDSDVTAIVLTTVNKAHADMLVAAAWAGKHIFVEHPLCLTMEDARRVRDAVKGSGVKFFMTDPMVEAGTQFVKSFMQTGKLGKIVSIRSRYCSNGPFLKGADRERYEKNIAGMGGGVMYNTGLHPFHVVQYLMGQPSEVFALYEHTSDVAKECGYDEGGCVMLRFPDGEIGFVETSMAGSPYTNVVEVTGTHGTIIERYTGDHKTEVWYRVPAEGDNPRDKADACDLTKWTRVAYEDLNPKPKPHVRYWVEMMAKDLPNDQVGIDPYSTYGLNIDDAVGLVAIAEAIYKAAEISGVKVAEY